MSNDFQLHSEPERTDGIRAEFLQDLDDSNHIEVSDWEAEFLESNLGRDRFSTSQRREIDRMISKYRGRL